MDSDVIFLAKASPAQLAALEQAIDAFRASATLCVPVPLTVIERGNFGQVFAEARRSGRHFRRVRCPHNEYEVGTWMKVDDAGPDGDGGRILWPTYVEDGSPMKDRDVGLEDFLDEWELEPQETK